jgi:hypothetical protein
VHGDRRGAGDRRGGTYDRRAPRRKSRFGLGQLESHCAPAFLGRAVQVPPVVHLLGPEIAVAEKPCVPGL